MLAIADIPVRSWESVVIADPLRVLLLDAVQDPGNVGTMLRTAAALGVSATVALPGTVDLWNAKVVRSGMGTHFTHAAFASTWDELDQWRSTHGVSLWGADAKGTPLVETGGAVPPRLALAVGNEGSGLTAGGRGQPIALLRCRSSTSSRSTSPSRHRSSSTSFARDLSALQSGAAAVVTRGSNAGRVARVVLVTAVLLWGALIGSFLNVCIARWPMELSVVAPRSRCPRCQRPITWYENIPVLSWIALRGRCRGCRLPISAQYPAVEVAVALLWLGSFAMFPSPFTAFRVAVFATVLAGVAVTDVLYYLIPDGFTVFGLGWVFATSVIAVFVGDSGGFAAPFDALLGACVGAASSRSSGRLGEVVLKKEAMGLVMSPSWPSSAPHWVLRGRCSRCS